MSLMEALGLHAKGDDVTQNRGCLKGCVGLGRQVIRSASKVG